MSAFLPLPQIVFYLALLFLPQGVLEFRTTINGNQITWTRANDGWRVQSAGSDDGTWSVKGNSVAASGQTTNMGKFVSVKVGEGEKKIVSLQDKPVATSANDGTITFSQEKGGALATPVVITYVREGPAK